MSLAEADIILGLPMTKTLDDELNKVMIDVEGTGEKDWTGIDYITEAQEGWKDIYSGNSPYCTGYIGKKIGAISGYDSQEIKWDSTGISIDGNIIPDKLMEVYKEEFDKLFADTPKEIVECIKEHGKSYGVHIVWGTS